MLGVFIDLSGLIILYLCDVLSIIVDLSVLLD